MGESATFCAAFPAIQSAIKVDGSGGGMRIQLDVPESEMAEAVKLLAWRQCVLRVTVRPESREQEHYTISRRKTKKRVDAGDTSL